MIIFHFFCDFIDGSKTHEYLDKENWLCRLDGKANHDNYSSFPFCESADEKEHLKFNKTFFKSFCKDII